MRRRHCLVLQHFSSGRLSALDAGREDGFLGPEWREQDVGVGYGFEQAVVPGDRCRRRTDQGYEFGPVEAVVGWEGSELVVDGGHGGC